MAASPYTPHDSAVPPSLPRAPGILPALALILLYFLLQAMASALLGFAAAMLEKWRHPQLSHAQIHQHAMDVLHRPDSNAMLVAIALPLIALIMFWLVQRTWPLLWTRAASPGFGLVAPTAPRWYLAALAIGLVMPPLGAWLTQLLAHGHEVTQNVQELSRDASSQLRLPLAIVAVTVGPMIEELMFRGVLLSALLQHLPRAAAIALCALLFGVVHLVGLDFQWYALPNLILLAAALCWLRLASASLWPAILAHALYNLFALVALFVEA
jgi:membrane protease YdiL (CAAX protease family)